MANVPKKPDWLDTIMHLFDWAILIGSIIAPPFILFRLAHSLSTHVIYLRGQCISQLIEPEVYWIVVFMHCVLVAILIHTMKHTWREIRIYQTSFRSM